MSEQCEWCGRFGARKVLSTIKGASSSSNPSGTIHLWLCLRCEREQIEFERKLVTGIPIHREI